VSARQIAQLGLALLGTYLIVNALAHASEPLTDRPILILEKNAAPPELLNSMLASTALGFVGLAVFGILPGVILILKSRPWAEAWFPESGALSQLSMSVLVPVGLVLLGLLFGISGVAGVVGGIAQVAAADGYRAAIAYGWRESTSSVVFLVSGALLFLRGRNLAAGAA
jgi:hypothetical protein